jgi:hypothetical protein
MLPTAAPAYIETGVSLNDHRDLDRLTMFLTLTKAVVPFFEGVIVNTTLVVDIEDVRVVVATAVNVEGSIRPHNHGFLGHDIAHASGLAPFFTRWGYKHYHLVTSAIILPLDSEEIEVTIFLDYSKKIYILVAR